MNANFDPDVGGGRGYCIAFTDQDSYASVQNYFTASNQWPVKEMTLSLWMRWVAVSPGGFRSWAFTVLAANDPNQVQLNLNVVQKENNWIPNLELYIANLVSFAPVKDLNSLARNWMHVTITFNLTDVSIYVNGTLARHTPGVGVPLRWADQSALFLGGYVEQQASDTKLVTAIQTEHFFGWMDDLAFYNRVLSVEEIGKNWQQAVDVTDSSLFLYYNFDEGPGYAVIKNHGTIGSQADLYNGQILGSTTYLETVTHALLPVKQGLFSPGVPLVGASSTLPVVFAVDAGASARLRITCPLTSTTTTAASLIPSRPQLVSLPVTGKIYQMDISQTRITTPHTFLTSAGAEFWYYGSATTNTNGGPPIVDSMQYSCVCNGLAQTGTINVIINPAVIPDQTISLVAVSGTTLNFNLHGSLDNPGLMKVNITSLPTLGRLSQWNVEQPDLTSLIVKPGTEVTNIINGIQYKPNVDMTGRDSFSYQLIHNGMISNIATVQLSVQSWDFPPVVPLSGTVNPVIILNRQATSLNLPVKDDQQKQYLGVYIMSLPTKGTLFQRNPDGSRGAIIDRPFQYSFPTPSIQYASKVLNVSSFWGTSPSWNPIQVLGPQDCFVYGDCTHTWAALTLSGTGGFAKGCGQGLCFASNPDENYLNYGYTEYIELGYNTSVTIKQLLNGENRGMGAVKNILAKDPLGNWMTLWTNPSVDDTVHHLYNEFKQYRVNVPDICQTPFFTNHIRYEIDTRDVSDWNEFDYFELQGLTAVDASMVNWYGKAKWDVIYVPDNDASGLDSFTYSATDCPGTSRVGFAQRWSPNVGTIHVNIVPVGTAGTAKINPTKGAAKIDLSIWSVNTNATAIHATAVTTAAYTTLSATNSAYTIIADATNTNGDTSRRGLGPTDSRSSSLSSEVALVTLLMPESTTTNNSSSSLRTDTHPFAFTITSLPPSSLGVLRDAKGVPVHNTPYPLPDSLLWFEAVPCCTASTCTQAQILQQQQTDNHTSFTYLSSDVYSKGPLSVSLAVVCPYVLVNANAPADVGIPVAIALAVIIFVAGVGYGIRQYVLRRETVRQQRMKEMERLETAAKHAEEETKKAEADQERERRLRHELQENIVNSAHDIKSPTTALGLAVESLLDALDNNKPINDATRQRVLETLHGMAHTIDALTMIINRSVDASKTASSSSRGFVPNKVPMDLKRLIDGVMAFSQWHAEDTGIEVVMEPLPADLPDEIMMDEKWLKDDLLCAASNAIKYSRTNQGVPALFRVAIVQLPVEGVANVPSPPSVQFTFIDSGYPLSDERLANLFNRPVHSERMQTGGMGLGLFCLSEHIQALQGQYGARRRSDGRDGTEIWFTFPLIVPQADLDQFVMKGLGYSTHRPKPRNSLMEKEAASMGTDETWFSSPQNRRSSTTKYSQKSRDSSLPFTRSARDSINLSMCVDGPKNSSTRGVREMDVRGEDVGGVERDRIVDGSVHGQNIGSNPRKEALIAFPGAVGVPVDASVAGAAGNASLDSLISIDISTRGSRKALLDVRKSADRIQEVLGALPILLVDDSVSILKLTKRAIQNECANISFMEAKNGEEAFERVVEAATSFELIVTDIQMPICDGFQFARKVRQLEYDKGLTPKLIIGISANDQQKIAEEAKASGMDGFMHKPFKLATLMDVIEDISSRRKQMLLQKMLFARDYSTARTMPLVVANPVAVASHNKKDNDCKGSGSGLFVGKNILVVDDAVSILKLMSHTLKNKAKAIVTQAKDGQQAVEECEKQHFDLILTDIQMPLLDGFGETRSIRAMEKERGLPRKIIVGISANTQDRMAVDAEEAGMDAFMDKPFKLEELTAVYIKLLERDHRNNQRDTSTHQTTVVQDVNTVVLGAVVHNPRSIYKVTPNAKIFIDASELNDMLATHMIGDATSLEQDGTLPAAAAVMSKAEWKGKVETGSVQALTGSGNGNVLMTGITRNAKVHAAN